MPLSKNKGGDSSTSDVPKVSVVIPLYNTERYIRECINSVLQQQFDDFEVLVVDDGSTDRSARYVQQFADHRVRYIFQENRGLPGARNTGIRHARGDYIAFLDADDYWHPSKLERHVKHLDGNPRLGVSYSGSAFINQDSNLIGVHQDPKLFGISAQDIYCMNPIGNGSAPVIRKATFDSIEFKSPRCVGNELWYFDEKFRQSEDVECWMRIALNTHWEFEGIAPRLTYYRVNEIGLSANWKAQLNSWLKMAAHINTYAPDFVTKNYRLAKAHQYRYLARRAIMSKEGLTAFNLLAKSIASHPFILIKNMNKTLLTLLCSFVLIGLGKKAFDSLVVGMSKSVVKNRI